jgi:hypothetical protein
MRSHSSLDTSALKDVLEGYVSENPLLVNNCTHLQHINALASDVAKNFVLLVEVTAEHFRGLVHSMLDLHSDTSTSLAFLDDLQKNRCKKNSP